MIIPGWQKLHAIGNDHYLLAQAPGRGCAEGARRRRLPKAAAEGACAVHHGPKALAKVVFLLEKMLYTDIKMHIFFKCAFGAGLRPEPSAQAFGLNLHLLPIVRATSATRQMPPYDSSLRRVPSRRHEIHELRVRSGARSRGRRFAGGSHRH